MITARRLRPCLLYTPPVAPTDLDGLASCLGGCAQARPETPRACPSGGRRSRNKAAVGEPAAGSFQSHSYNTECKPINHSIFRTTQRATVDHWARASTKNVARSEIGGGEPQPYANRHFSNVGGKPRIWWSGAQLLRWAAPIFGTNQPALHHVRRRAELKHISKPRKRKQTRCPE